MLRLAVMFVVALLLIDAAIAGNIGSLIGAIIDPANMTDLSSPSAGAQSSNAGAGNF